MASTPELPELFEGLTTSQASPAVSSVPDTMSRLPVEISSDIFLRSAPNAQASSVLVRVSRAWNRIALGTPSLWTTLSNDGIPAAKFPVLLKAWFARGQGLPVSLSQGPMLPSAFLQTVEVLANNSQLVQTLNIYLHDGALDKISCISFGALRHLTIDASEDERVGTSADLIALVRGAPNLVECNLNEVFYTHQNHSLDGLGSFTHSSLKHLRFGKSQDGFKRITASPAILSCLKLPSLQTLRVFFTRNQRYTENDLVKFLTQSPAPLRALHIGFSHRVRWRAAVLESLQLVSTTLTELEILHPRNLATTLFDALDVNADLLPRLQSLHVRGYLDGDNLPEPQRISNVLKARRGSVKSFRICAVDEEVEFFGGVAAVLRPFADAGVDVYVGTLFQNFV
ncbi:hypothetical protein FB45DRAFT_899511 [Roridomyces roridus]|uniref:F-box domain-containing protein n=1 Tax=Roridomyces roridus TaxID=1738132 RepID=A0AAD7FV79_9AGAR|nr:hypothetical protein FB45DRAFT_899511 [Roridomyces roridus]